METITASVHNSTVSGSLESQGQPLLTSAGSRLAKLTATLAPHLLTLHSDRHHASSRTFTAPRPPAPLVSHPLRSPMPNVYTWPRYISPFTCIS
ncbi:hypothetical protein E2C01_074680 [Portunus trituberculatus]|uniref:Uncharacterized protein n=1 Tax=Portunus trituberculatus TaxID=210409 RepID=A0A5B7ICW6_PORTR|nr:hypothetical protein [Portunus trituberculatus]